MKTGTSGSSERRRPAGPDVSDLLIFAGLAAVGYGLALIWLPLMYLFSGGVLFVAGIILGRQR